MTDATPHEALALKLWQAAETRTPCLPLTPMAEDLGVAIDATNAYAVQRINRDRRLRTGDRVVGRKIGLTARSVQQQLGVDSPDFGDLWARSSYGDRDVVQFDSLIQARLEVEVALVMGRDVDTPYATVADIIRATEFALPAMEIVDSRIADWKIGLFDTIADNASASGFVLGADPVRLDHVSLRNATMRMMRNGVEASTGIGSACLGHPLNAAAWLARALAAVNNPLRAGDIVLTGALGPMVPIAPGDEFDAQIEGLGTLSVGFA